MAEPTLGEITSIHGDPNLGLADAGVASNVIAPNNTELAYLDAAARRRDAANKFILEQHNANLKNTLDNYNNIDTSGLFSPDYKDITDQYKNLTSKIYDNYDIIQNPNKNPELYSQLMQEEAALRSKIAQSKAQGLVYNQNQKLLEAHPEFYTADNLKAQQQFINAPIDQRQIPNITPPTVYDPLAIVKAAATYSTQKLASSAVAGGYIKDQTEEKTDPEQFMNGVKAYLQSSNGYGGTYNDALQKQYNQLPPQIKNSESYDEFLNKTFAPLIPKSSITASSIKGDPITEEQMREKNSLLETRMRINSEQSINASNHTFQLALEKQRALDDLALAEKKGEIRNDKLINKTGEILNTQTASIFDPQNFTSKALEYTDVKSGTKRTGNIVSVPEDVKKAFAYEKQDATTLNKKVNILPDDFVVLPNGKVMVVFHEKTADGKPMTTPGGAPKVDMEHTQEFSADGVRSSLLKAIDPKQRAAIENAALQQSPTLNNPDELKKYGAGKSSTAPAKKPTTTEDPLGIL
jgi:hypothetical protein